MKNLKSIKSKRYKYTYLSLRVKGYRAKKKGVMKVYYFPSLALPEKTKKNENQYNQKVLYESFN